MGNPAEKTRIRGKGRRGRRRVLEAIPGARDAREMSWEASRALKCRRTGSATSSLFGTHFLALPAFTYVLVIRPARARGTRRCGAYSTVEIVSTSGELQKARPCGSLPVYCVDCRPMMYKVGCRPKTGLKLGVKLAVCRSLVRLCLRQRRQLLLKTLSRDETQQIDTPLSKAPSCTSAWRSSG